jgi:thiamine pyrophosphokinase
MTAMIVQTDLILTLFGASPTQLTIVKQAVNDAVILVAADGGASVSVAAGRIPDAVVGDMDSILPETRAAIPSDCFHHIAEQDSTDFEKCLRRIKAGAIIAFGFLGGRIDHELAACTALVRHPEQICIMVGEEDICFLAPSEFGINLPLGTRFSLFPMGPVSGTSSGLKYKIDGLAFTPATQVGTSNEVTGPVSLTFETRQMLIILPRETLADVLQVLAPQAYALTEQKKEKAI